MRLLYLFILIIVCLQANSQTECNQNSKGLPLVLCSDIPTSINVCEQTQTVTFYIENSTTHVASSITDTVFLPLGIEYVPGSVVGVTESDLSDLSAPIFSSSDISPGNQTQFTINITVNCEIFDNLPGALFNFNLSLGYDINSIQSSSTHTTEAITIFEPALSIVNVTNQVYSGLVGDVFTRCITITNSGIGYVRNFQFTENHGADIVITNVDLNNITTQSSTSLILDFGASLISNIGDGDALFENGESITFCQEIRVDDCREVSSLYQASWGCEGLNCQEKKGGGASSANVTFPDIIPNISSTAGDLNSPQCIDGPIEQFLKFKNDGVGEATNLVLTVLSGNLNLQTVNAGYAHYFDTNTIQVLYNGVSQSFLIDTIYSTTFLGLKGCTSSDRVLGFRLILPNVQSLDSLDITFDLQYCDLYFCRSKSYNTWSYKLDYESICGDKYFIDPKSKIGTGIGLGIIPNSPVVSFNDGETNVIDFTINGYALHRFPNNSRSKWILEIKKNSCFNIKSGINIYNEDSTEVWNSDRIEESDTLITATFLGPVPYNIRFSTLSYALEGNCNNCPTVTIDTSAIPECSRFGGVSTSSSGLQSSVNLDVDIKFIPDTTCNVVMDLSCNDGVRAEMSSCNSGCDSGLVVRSSIFERTTLGQPDVDEDGQPDNNGKASHPDVRLDRVVLGDTVNNRVLSVMNFPNGSTWDLCYVRTTFNANFDYLNFIKDTVYVKRGGTTYKISNIVPQITISGASGDYLYDLTASTLIANGDLPAGFRYQHNDTIIFSGFYRVVKNIHANFGVGINFFLEGNTSMHVNDSIEPTRNCHRFTCNSAVFNLEVLPIIYYTGGSSAGVNSVVSCDIRTYYRRTVYYVGSYGRPVGTNFFPKEFRSFGTLDTVIIDMPEGYEFISARYRELRHFEDSIDNHIWSNNTSNANLAYIDVSPVIVNGNKLFFDIEGLYDNVNLFKPDETYVSDFDISMRPTCEVPKDSVLRTNYSFKWNGQYGDSVVDHVIDDRYINFRHIAPKLDLVEDLIDVFPIHDTVVWEVAITNNSQEAPSYNTWLGEFSDNPSVNILNIYDIDNDTALINSNGVFQGGVVLDETSRKFRIVASFNTCVTDSIILAAGWDCPGYPDSVKGYLCEPLLTTLYFTPKLPNIQDSISIDNSITSLCDTVEYIVYLKNAGEGTAYNFNFNSSLPNGMTYIPSSSQIEYPIGTSVRSINEPTITGADLTWDLTTYDSILSINGFHGTSGENENELEVRFKVISSCGFTSGSSASFFNDVTANCGELFASDITTGPSIIINDAIPPYETKINVSSFKISPCNDNETIEVSIYNDGPNDITNQDSITVDLPSFLVYQGNYIGVNNAPLASSLSQGANNLGDNRLTWKLPNGIVVGDSIKFTFEVQGNSPSLSCQTIPQIKAFSTITLQATCVSSSTICNVQSITGDTLRNAFVSKSTPVITNLEAASVQLTPSGEEVTIDFDFIAAFESIDGGINSTLYIYHDLDGDSILSPGDVLIDSIINTNQFIADDTVHFNTSTVLNAGSLCNGIIVTLDTAKSDCFCDADFAYASIVLDLQLRDTTVCSGGDVLVGIDSIQGYLYSWSPSLSLDDSLKSNPLFNKEYTGTTIDSTKYILTVDRGGCFAYDSLIVEVFPLPVVDAGSNTMNCEQSIIQLVGNNNLPFETSVWAEYTNTTGNSIAIIDNDSAQTQAVINGYGEVFFVLSKQNDYCPIVYDSVEFINYEQPTATANPIFLCDTDSSALVGAFTPNQASAHWSKENATNIDIDDSLSMNTFIRFINSGQSEIYLNVVNGVCPIVIDTVEVENLVPHEATLPVDSAICEPTSILVVGNAPDLMNFEIGEWDIDSSANPNITLIAVNDSSALVSGLVYGDNRVIWKVYSNYCTPSYDTMSIVVWETPVATAINDIDGCEMSEVTLTSSFTPSSATDFYWNVDQNYPSPNTPTLINANTINAQLSTLIVGSYQVYFSVENGVCPVSQDSVIIYNRPNPDADFINNPSAICANGCIEFINQSTVAVTDTIIDYIWYGNDSILSLDEEPSICFNTPGTMMIMLVAETNNGCKDTAYSTPAIEVYPNPVAGFDFSPKSCLKVDQNIVVEDMSSGATNYTYDFGDRILYTNSAPNHHYTDTGIYEMIQIVANQLGCTDTSYSTVSVGEQSVVYIPNAFSPDGNGVNDFYKPVVSGLDEYNFRIYTRWGEEVFSSDNPNQFWDGTENGKLGKQDVYVWKLTYKETCDDKTKTIRGHVTLIK